MTDFDRLPVDYWFSIPGVYSGVAKSQMLDAIQTAGYTGRPQDNVYFLSEGEAAAVAVQHRLSDDKVRLHTRFFSLISSPSPLVRSIIMVCLFSVG